jgi:hypothetical protein
VLCHFLTTAARTSTHSDDGGVALVLTSYDLYANGPGTSLAGSGVNQGEIILDILSRASHTFLLTGKLFLAMISRNVFRGRNVTTRSIYFDFQISSGYP